MLHYDPRILLTRDFPAADWKKRISEVTMDYSELRAQARELLTGLWGKAALMWLIFICLSSGAGFIVPGLGQLVSLIVGGPFSLGICLVFLKVWRREDFIIDDLFAGFSDFTRSFVAFLLVTLYTFLWSLLLIIPGIIAALSYSQTFYIMAENSGMPADQAIERSKALMQGHKSEFFFLMLSFIGWALLSILTFGIGFFWLYSYMEATKVIYYKRLTGAADARIIRDAPPANNLFQ